MGNAKDLVQCGIKILKKYLWMKNFTSMKVCGKMDTFLVIAILNVKIKKNTKGILRRVSGMEKGSMSIQGATRHMKGDGLNHLNMEEASRPS
jgi:hypothetical protein